jgi:cytoskeletal protein CcmA (bactofilin family)
VNDAASRCLVLAAAIAAAFGSLCACGGPGGDESSRVNGSVHIRAGKAANVAETVNGAVDIDPNATVTGAKTVNGGIHLGAGAAATSLNTVNGGITLDAGSHVAGAVETVNGSLTLHSGATIGGSLENVNGKIELDAAQVAGGIKTIYGSIDIEGPSRVEHGIWVEKPSGFSIHLGSEVPRIVIGSGATIEGELRFDHPVHLYVSDRATIGQVVGATATAFSGDSPLG